MSNDVPGMHSQEGPLINWQYLWMITKRHYLLFFAIFIPVIGATVAYLMVTKPVYQSIAVVKVLQRDTGAIRTSSDPTEDLTSADAVQTIEQSMQSYDLFQAVVKTPDIANDPDFLVGFHGSKDAAPSTADLADWLASNVKIELRHGTRLIDVTVFHRVPRMAQKLALAIVTTYITVGNQNLSSAQQANLQVLNTQSAEIKKNLQSAEQALETFKDLKDLSTRIDAQRTVIDQLKERYREKHPQMIQAHSLLDGLNKDFDEQFQKSMTNPVNKGSAPLDIDPAKASFEDKVSAEIKFVEARANVLQKEVDTESALFDNVLKQQRDTDVGQGDTATSIQLVGPPLVPTKPSKPKKTVVLLLGISMATFLGLGAVVAVRTVNATIDTPMEAEAVLGLPVLGTILRATPKKGSGAAAAVRAGAASGALSDEMVVATDPGSATAEGFRSLRAVINLLGKPADHRTILFTSALPGEGKTYVSCNYALSLSMTGVRTLLIDSDLRRPAVHERLKLENKIGLAEMINQELQLPQVVHAKVAKNFDVLTAGGPCPNPAELLAGDGFRMVLAKALASYDRVVIDTGPVNLVSDCLLVAPEVSTVCFVLRAGTTARQAPRHAINLLRRAQKEPTGVILNAIAPGSDRVYLGYKGRGGVGSYGNVYS